MICTQTSSRKSNVWLSELWKSRTELWSPNTEAGPPSVDASYTTGTCCYRRGQARRRSPPDPEGSSDASLIPAQKTASPRPPTVVPVYRRRPSRGFWCNEVRRSSISRRDDGVDAAGGRRRTPRCCLFTQRLMNLLFIWFLPQWFWGFWGTFCPLCLRFFLKPGLTK